MSLRLGFQASAAQAVSATAQTPTPNLTVSDNDIDTLITITTPDASGLKELLKLVRAEDLLEGKILEYAGFYLDSNDDLQWDSTSPDRGNEVDLPNNPVSTIGQPNKSIDKLTFLIMFNLAYQAYEADKTANNNVYGDPLVTNTNCWSYLANEVRGDFSLKRLNSAGEQILPFDPATSSVPVAGNYPVDDSGNILGAFGRPDDVNEFVPFCNDNSYNYLKTPANQIFPDTLQSEALALNVSTPAQERANLFDTSNHSTNLPWFWIQLAETENPYKVQWINKKKCKPHIPRAKNKNNKVFNSRRLIRSTTSWSGADPINGCNIQKDLSTGDYYVYNGQRYYIELAKAEDIAFYNLNLEGATVLYDSTRQVHMAVLQDSFDGTEYYDKYGVNKDGTDQSGLSFGIGVDIGNKYAELYKVNFTVEIDNNAGLTCFNLYYHQKISSDLDCYSITREGLQNAIFYLLKLNAYRDDNKNNIIVSEPVVNGSTTTFNVEIKRRNHFAINGKIYSATTDLASLNPAISISPINEIDRWTYLSDNESNGWSEFVSLMNKSFSGNPPSGDSDYWLKQNGMTTSEQAAFKETVKKMMGIRHPVATDLFLTWESLIMKFTLTKYVQHIAATYQVTALTSYNYTVIETNIINNLVSAKLNQFEMYLLTSLAWLSPGKIAATDRKSNVIRSIQKHDYNEIKAHIDEFFLVAVKGYDERQKYAKSLLNNLKKKLYRNAVLN